MSHASTIHRDIPPHLSTLAAPATADSVGPTGPDTTIGGTSAFLSAKTTTSDAGLATGDPESASSGEHTTSNDSPSGMRVRVCMDSLGRHYVIHPETGMQFDVEDDESGAPSSSLSSTSDMAVSTSGNSAPVAPGERALDALMTDIGATLTPEQNTRYAVICGMLSTGRASLLSTTAFVAEQRSALGINVRAIALVRDETESRLKELHQSVVSQDEHIEQCLEANLRALRSFGSTEAQLEQLTRSMTEYTVRGSPQPTIAPLSQSASRAPTPLIELHPELEGALPQRGLLESEDAFHRRALAAVQRKERTANTFATHPFSPDAITAPTLSAVQFATKNTWFEDVGSISTAPRRPALLEGSQHDSFHKDKESIIRKIVAREIRAPKVDAPTKYAGADDVDIFMKFVEMLCTWLRSQLLGGYEPVVDTFQLTMLKLYLIGPALDWFIQSVNSAHFAPSERMSFADALCALHRRFVTTANAQRATKAFDAVRYSDTAGPEAFAEALIKHANQMAHVPDEFMVNQRFLAGLPSTIRYKLRVDWEMSAEYTPFERLRNGARQLWEVLAGEDTPRASLPRGTVPAPRTTAVVNTRPPVAAPNPVLRRPVPSPALPSHIPHSEDTRTCFKCGGVGHIGSNPRCPRFNEPTTARVGAQRVLESYADGEHSLNDAGVDATEEGPAGDEYDGLWGWLQFDPEDEDPNMSPDLAELVDMADSAGVEEDARMGAMRARYFSMRVPVPDEEDAAEAPTASTSTASSAAVLDPVRMQIQLPPDVQVYTDWDAAEEARQASLAAASIPERPVPTFESLLAEFEARSGTSSLSPSQSFELEAIDALGAEEHARAVWRGLMVIEPQLIIGYTPSFLRTTAVNVEEQATTFAVRISETWEFQQDIVSLLSRRLEARDELARLLALPASAKSRVPGILRLAEHQNNHLCDNLEQHFHLLERQLERLLDSQRAIDTELTRCMLAREAYAVESARAANSPSSTRMRAHSLRLETEGDNRPLSGPTVDNPQVETTHVVDNTDRLSPPPALGSTPPPSYPGTPESSGSETLWDQVSDHQAAVNSAPVLPGDAVDPVVWISSDSDSDAPLALRATRVEETHDEVIVQLRTQRLDNPKAVERLSNREIRFPNGKIIHALSAPEEAAFVPAVVTTLSGSSVPAPPSIPPRISSNNMTLEAVDEEEVEFTLPSLPSDYPITLELDSDYVSLDFHSYEPFPFPEHAHPDCDLKPDCRRESNSDDFFDEPLCDLEPDYSIEETDGNLYEKIDRTDLLQYCRG
ncbi:hypothetical protein DFH09DRAFT_1107375 [Mycena vulgaris]|nr:hypothetical protein DFH09DRAFT_1107375 [Mycena vulgaris]